MIEPDPQLAPHAATIENSLAKAAMSFSPDQIASLTGRAERSLLKAAASVTRSGSISLWIADPARENLVMTHCEPNQQFIGSVQPLSEGLISLTYASEQPLCENKVYLSADHSKRIDKAFSQVTCAMIATPFYLANSLRGVVSCVQVKDSIDAEDPPGFTARGLNRITLLTSALERLITYRLLTGTLGIEL